MRVRLQLAYTRLPGSGGERRGERSQRLRGRWLRAAIN
jgi:hypothetical protein